MTNTDKVALSAAEQWQELICRLPEVLSANVVFSADGSPSEIHVLASDNKSSKSIVRDVQSALSASFGVPIDYHIISIAQIRENMSKSVDKRFRCVGSDMRSIDGHLDVTVTLNMHGDIYTGSASGTTSLYSRRVCLVEATLAAVASYSGDLVFEFEGLQTAQVGNSSAILVQINCPPTNQTLLGSAIISADADASVINSTLNAINRRVSLLP